MRNPKNGKILYVSPAATDIWGIDLPTLLADPGALMQSVHPDDREVFRQHLAGQKYGTYGPLEYRIIHPDTGVRWILDRSFPIRDGDGRLVCISCVATDITEEKAALESEAVRRADFLTIASHELRTPLQPVVGYLYLMLANPQEFGLTAEGTLFLEEIQKSIDRLNEVVNRILTVGLADTEREIVQPHRETVSLETLVSRVVRACTSETDASCVVEIPPGTAIETDRHYLYEALHEIFANAVKHTAPPHRITLTYTTEAEDHLLTISDNGPGMDEETCRNLFNPFFIGDSDKLSRTCGRLGLGLAIAKKDIEQLGGTISVASTPGQGSRFTIRLPKEHT